MNLFKTLRHSLCCNKNLRFLSTRRKIPLDPDYTKDMPVFQYGPAGTSHRRRVYVWGNAKTGALGIVKLKKRENLERIEYIQNPKRISFAERYDVTKAACGYGFTAFTVHTDEGDKIFGCGLNRDSQIGCHLGSKDKHMDVLFLPHEVHIPYSNPAKVKILKVSAGRAHLAVLTTEGLYTLGNNSYGQCARSIIADEDYGGNKYVHHIPDVNKEPIVDVVCGQDHTIVLTESGAVYGCGWGADGQTGLQHFGSESTLTQLLGDIKGEKIVKVSSACDFVLAVNDCGDVFGWGNNEYAQLDLPENPQQVATPTHVKMCRDLGKAVDVAAGGCFCMVLNEEGHVYTWGFGLLGVGPEVQTSKTPVKIPSQLFGLNDFNPYVKVDKIACGMGHMAALTNHGNLYVWGRNRDCCLGLGSTKDQYFPLKVSLGGIVADVACGLDHTVAVCKPFI